MLGYSWVSKNPDKRYPFPEEPFYPRWQPQPHNLTAYPHTYKRPVEPVFFPCLEHRAGYTLYDPAPLTKKSFRVTSCDVYPKRIGGGGTATQTSPVVPHATGRPRALPTDPSLPDTVNLLKTSPSFRRDMQSRYAKVMTGTVKGTGPMASAGGGMYMGGEYSYGVPEAYGGSVRPATVKGASKGNAKGMRASKGYGPSHPLTYLAIVPPAQKSGRH